ncbi:hypothetical protein SJ05684_b48040 (plasmid) [Sinorhizobium sojae CCBAU 05684]|uniref:Uncharacterized protein n=1 Tax=Sinorhizobium sojae CCBAU 05684 TaxID=716928 RepID=A0A249PJ11_9HYPH|nr:hypothetical protein [Sinorhizobium sojae]ASY65786.1 hypothetical protein SJ05684_b48040 [Sinorhizobium sojae CCBAU 05684]
MAKAYLVGPIQRHQVDRAFRLIEVVGYELDLTQWREFCAAAFARQHMLPYAQEIVTVENARGYIAGLSIGHIAHDPLYGRLLDVPVFLVISAGDTPGVSDALLEHLMTAARNRRCSFIRIASTDPANWPDRRGRPRQADRGTLIPVQ